MLPGGVQVKALKLMIKPMSAPKTEPRKPPRTPSHKPSSVKIAPTWSRLKPMARMVPPPIHHGTRILKIKLAPRQKLSKKILLKGKPGVSAKDASRFYTVVRPAPKKARHARQQRRARQAG